MRYLNLYLPVLALIYSGFFQVVYGQVDDKLLLSPIQLQEDFFLLRKNLEEVQPGLYTYTPKHQLEAIFDSISNQLDRPMSPIDFYRTLVPILKPLGNNHTNIFPPKTYDQSLVSGRLRFPFRFYLRMDTLFVFEDASHEQLLRVGTVIRTVNGENALDLIEKMKNFYTRDGYNESSANWYLSIGFSKRYAYYFGTPDSYTIGYLDKDGAEQEVEIKALTFDEIKANQRRLSLPDLFPKEENYVYKDLGGIAYLKVKSFEPPKALAFMRFLSKSFREIQKNQPQALILDVRNNAGGFPEATYMLLRYLIKEKIKPVIAEYARVKTLPNPEYYVKDQFFNHFNKQKLLWKNNRYEVKRADKTRLKPRSNAFHGKLYVLINERCFSATGEFLGQVQSHTDAVFVGVEAGGNPVTQAASDLFTLILPHSKLEVIIPGIKTEMHVHIKNTGHGVQPDVEIIPRVEDILAGRDVQLTWILQEIKRNRK